MLIGLPAAGKTTLAKQLEGQQSALRLTPDEWMESLGFDLFDEEARARVEALQWQQAERALQLGVSVVQDFGVWSREERDRFRARAEELGAWVELRYLDVPLAILWSRLESRNRQAGATLFTREMLDEWSTLFERPGKDELA